MALGMSGSASGLLPTVVASSGGRTLPPGTTRTGRAPDGSKKTVSLEQALKMTPERLDRKGASANSGDGLATVLNREPLPTLCARDYRAPGKKSYADRGGGQKGEQLPFVAGGPLNGDWCEWHMGVPRGWTKLEPMKLGDFDRWLSGEGAADWDAEWPDVPRTGGDAKNRVQRITALGNAQVPACAALAWRTLMRRALN